MKPGNLGSRLPNGAKSLQFMEDEYPQPFLNEGFFVDLK
jgi:hypothetical protein